MTSLPQELWHQIAGEVYATGDMGPILAMCLSSRLLQDAANPWLYQCVDLNVNKPHQITSFACGITSGTAKHVRVLIVSPRARITDTLPSGTLEHLVRSLPKLHTFSWRCSLPIGETLLKVLNNHQNVKDVRIYCHLARPLEKKLHSSALSTNWKLSHLSLLVEWDHRPNLVNPNFRPCQTAILNAPNLVQLSVRIQYPNEGAWGYIGHSVGAFKFPTDKLLPPIKVLALWGYAVGLGYPEELEHRIQIPALRELILVPGPVSNLRNFLATLMRSGQVRLELLHIHWEYPSIFNSSTPGWPAFFEAFLQHFKGLKKLTIKGAIHLPLLSLADSISSHGETLEELTLHHSSVSHGLPIGPYERQGAAARDVKTLCDTCPRLHALTLDLHFGDDLALQRSFQHFQALEKLTIYSPLCGENMHLLEPRVNLRYVYALAVQLRSPRLREVTLNVGGVETTSVTLDFNNENIRHRMVWHIEYPGFDDGYAGIKVWESLRQGEEIRMEGVVQG